MDGGNVWELVEENNEMMAPRRSRSRSPSKASKQSEVIVEVDPDIDPQELSLIIREEQERIDSERRLRRSKSRC
jgi:hypothetical protein